MAKGTQLLNQDGSASMATLLMLSHHAFRRDLRSFERALGQLHERESGRAGDLRGEWRQFHGALHGHHEMEDANIFPGIKQQNPALGANLDRLSEQHRRIDPLLSRGDSAFDGMTDVGAARAVVEELSALLDEHLSFEEETIVPALRGVKQFPPPPDDAAAELYAGGFAWSMHGVDDGVIAEVKKLLPESLLSRLPAAIETFDERCLRVWGSAKTAKSSTSVPAS
ncbi:MAG TPA: hemerythrin domain-containing protein [Polyangiaceae bacterium]|nr:hemerythrin domain-containing protein [Polyangiaceae bacterium]